MALIIAFLLKSALITVFECNLPNCLMPKLIVPFLKDGMPFLRYFTNKLMSFFTSKLFGIKLTEFHTGCKIYSKNFCEKVPVYKSSDNYLFSFQIILQARFYKRKYGEISISSSYEGYKTSCNYSNGLIYLMGNFKYMLIYVLVKLKLIKSEIFS